MKFKIFDPIALVWLIILAPLMAEARTATYCEGPEWVFEPPEKCFEVDTSVIGGMPIENFVVKRPDVLLLDTDARRYELSALSSDTVDKYCRDEIAGLEDLPDISIDNVAIVFHDRQDEEGGIEANITLSLIETSDGYTYESFQFVLVNATAIGKLEIGIGPDFEPSLSDLGLGLVIWLQAYVNESTGYRADNLALEERLAFYALPADFRRMLYAILIELPEIIARADAVSYRDDPETSAWPELNWAIESAETYVGLAFQIPAIEPVITLDCREYDRYGDGCVGEVGMEEFRDSLGNYIADYLGSGRASSSEFVLNGLRDWASADALSNLVGINEPGGPDFRTRYEINFFILTALQAWSILLQDGLVSPSDRQLVENWFAGIIEYTAIENRYNDPLTNIGYLERGVVMAWGILTGNDELFADGVEKIYLGLNRMRTDGSFPREAARHDAAFNYQNQLTLNLLFLAELAAEQGYDPYGWSGPEGTTLHDPVTFMLDALDDPAQLEEYAYMYPGSPSNNYDLPIFYDSVIRPSFGGRPSQYAHGKWLDGVWVEPYMRRFPNHPNTVRLKDMFFEVGLEESRPLFHSQFGGNTTCYSAMPIEGFNHPVMGEVIVMGGNAPGEVLTAGTSSLSDNDGLGDFSFQWYRNGSPIPLATLQNYTIEEMDLGQLINVSVNYVDQHGNEEEIFGESRLPAQPTSSSYNDLIEMYVIILGRAPAQGGLDFWSGIINDGKDFEYVASEMWNSAGAREFYPSDMSTEEVVTSVYVNILVREPKQGGLNYWVAQWEKNGPVDTMLEMINALTANNSDDPLAIADKKLFQAKVDIGGYLANTVKNTDVDLASQAFEYLNSGSSVEETKVYVDSQL